MPPKMRRLTAYVTGSLALATAVTSWAFYERPNFYSAAVYLSQSSACLLVLSNLAFISFLTVAYALQRLLFGRLRPIEIEQLYERGWIAATEWLFAMSIFRDEFGPWYLSMFMLLFMGKVWGWLAEGRVEVLEQQTPANPYLFHSRLVASLVLYIIAAANMFWYCLDEVIYEARPGVMIMFVFEWAIICIGAFSICFKYGLWAYEQVVVKRQEKERREELRREAAESREAGQENAEIAEEELDIHDLDLPGWESKGTWIFGLDIATDFLKLLAYVGFFAVLTAFYGIPIYIIRDLYMTLRSFSKRIHDYIKYENATRDMHTLYPDATVDELTADNTCIVCREEMYPWIGTTPRTNDESPPQQRATSERKRPKKLPCGHILHFQCLRSWLERQQACPICRRSVLDRPAPQPNGTGNPGRPQQPGGNNAARHGAHDHGPGADQAAARQDGHAPLNRPAQPGGFNFALGPLRMYFGPVDGARNGRVLRIERVGRGPQPAAANAPQPQAANPPSAQQAPINEAQPNSTVPIPTTTANNVTARFPELASTQPLIRHHIIHTQLNAMETYLWQAMQHAQVARERIGYLRQLQNELERTRLTMQNLATMTPPPVVGGSVRMSVPAPTVEGLGQPGMGIGPIPIIDPSLLGANGPPALALPEGWRMVPLQSLTNPQQQAASAHNTATQPPTGQSMPQVNAFMWPPTNQNPLATLQSTFATSAQVLQDLMAPGAAQGIQRPSNSSSNTPPGSSPLSGPSSFAPVPPPATTTTISHGPVIQSTTTTHSSSLANGRPLTPSEQISRTPTTAPDTPDRRVERMPPLEPFPDYNAPPITASGMTNDTSIQLSNEVPTVQVSSPTSPVINRSTAGVVLGQHPAPASSSNSTPNELTTEQPRNGELVGGTPGWSFGDISSTHAGNNEQGHRNTSRQPTVEDALDPDDLD